MEDSKHQLDHQRSVDRKYYIDFLKVVGLLGLMLAHVKSPDWLLQLRSFDVILMVIISGILAKDSFSRCSESYLKYAKKRFVRLVIPTWIFMLFYFSYRMLYGEVFDWRYYLDSFLLTRYGMSYVWIILIYMYCALLTPLIYKMRYSRIWVILAILLYTMYEVACYFELGTNLKLLESTVFYIIPYGLLYAIGMQYGKISNRRRWLIIIGSVLIFATLGAWYFYQTGTFQLVSIRKYPPRLYYISYGLAVSFILLIICERIKTTRLFRNSIIRFISTHSLWIYLWHIIVLDITTHFFGNRMWILQFVIVSVISCLITYLQNLLLDLLDKKHHIAFFKCFRG